MPLGFRLVMVTDEDLDGFKWHAKENDIWFIVVYIRVSEESEHYLCRSSLESTHGPIFEAMRETSA